MAAFGAWTFVRQLRDAHRDARGALGRLHTAGRPNARTPQWDGRSGDDNERGQWRVGPSGWGECDHHHCHHHLLFLRRVRLLGNPDHVTHRPRRTHHAVTRPGGAEWGGWGRHGRPSQHSRCGRRDRRGSRGRRRWCNRTEHAACSEHIELTHASRVAVAARRRGASRGAARSAARRGAPSRWGGTRWGASAAGTDDTVWGEAARARHHAYLYTVRGNTPRCVYGGYPAGWG